MTTVNQMKVSDLKQKFDQKEKFRLIDCREQGEYDTCRIEGSELMPLSQFAQLAPAKLAKDEQIVIHCHHGGRSQRACDYLKSIGYEDVSNLAGGIDAWACEIDESVKRY